MWSRRSIEIFIGATLLAIVTACSVTPKRAVAPARTTPVAAHAAVAGKGGTAGAAAQAGAAQGAQAPPTPPPIPAAAKAEFDQALTLARAGNQTAAEARLASLAQEYPQFCTPLVDLGVLYRKSGNLDAAAQAFQQAAAREPHSALAWTELGVTQRLGGRFQDAEQSYTRAIAADPAYAPAYRDRGVLRDLYLDQPAAALGDFAQYRKLAAQDKPVLMWMAELQHRTGIKQPVAASTAAAPQPQVRN
ncbi:MAG TPA: tetratricopeptide repeat protein [Steroidobacteraceae bacterium]